MLRYSSRSLLATLTLVAFVVGCSGSKEKPEPPAKLVDFKSTLDVRRAWSQKVGGGSERLRLALRPASDGARVYAGSVDGRLRGFAVRDGSTVWTVDQNLPSLTLRSNTAPRLAGNIVVAGFNNGRVGAYEIANGDAAWEVAVANPTGRSELDRLVDVSSSIQVVATEAYVVGYHGRVVGIDISTGVVLWQQDMSSFAGLSA